MKATAFSLQQFQEELQSNKRKQTLNLENATTDEVFISFILSKKNMTQKQKKQISNVARIIRELRSGLPTYKFDEDFNWNLYHYITSEEGLGLKPSTGVQYMRILVNVLKWAGTRGAQLTDSFDTIPIEYYEPHRICPTMAEIAQIYFFNIDNLPYRKDCRKTLEKVRDTYVMNAIGYGLRYSDLKRLTKDSFQGNEMKIVQQKTGRIVKNEGDMVLFKSIMNELLDKYPNHEIPFQGCISNYNKYLKKYLQHMGGSFDKEEIIEYRSGGTLHSRKRKRWEMFASHSARRGFITNNICEKKQELMKVQHAVGHKHSEMTERYIVNDNE